MKDSFDSEEQNGTGSTIGIGRIVMGFVALILLTFCLCTILSPAIFVDGRKISHRAKCSRQLRQLALSSILYGEDFGFFPHMAGKDEDQSAEQISDAFRTLYYLDYIESPKSFICVQSEDQERPLNNAVKDRRKAWDWLGQIHSQPQLNPVKSSSGLSVFDNKELSYTMRKRQINVSSLRSDTPILADKVCKNGRESFGHHKDGCNVAFGDGHVEFRQSDEKELIERLFSELRMTSNSEK